MNQHYKEILEKFGIEPLWFTEGGYPRWCEMHPSQVDDIYADQVVFAVIACQNCEKTFTVAFSSSKHGRLLKESECLLSAIDAKVLHYGDPPNVRCCPAGPTMNSELIHVSEVWERNLVKLADWQRVPDFEDER